MMFAKPWLVTQQRLCDNHCDGQLRDIGAIGAIGHGHGGAGDCVGCRKRKEHEDFAENEAKFSKQSPAEDSVTYLMRKWASSTETQEERDAVCPPPVPAAVLDEKFSGSATTNFTWMQRPRYDSFKENSGEDNNNNNNNSSSSSHAAGERMTKGRFIITECDESLSLSEKHRATVPGKTKSSRSKTKQLSRKLSALQSKIETESEVFQQKMGYRPSYADKMKCEEISDLVQEKEKIKLELKDLTEEGPRKKGAERTIEQERDRIVQQLDALRLSVGRPYSLDSMTSDQIADERRDLQSLLTEFEKKSGREEDKVLGFRRPGDKEVMAGLYERYRAVRRLCRRQSNELTPIPEHDLLDTLELSQASWGRGGSNHQLQPEDAAEEEDSCGLDTAEMTSGERRHAVARSAGGSDAKWHTMSFVELSETLGELKESKKVYKRQINEVESGTTSIESDTASINDVYVLYKATKYKIKLIRALIEKHASKK